LSDRRLPLFEVRGRQFDILAMPQDAVRDIGALGNRPPVTGPRVGVAGGTPCDDSSASTEPAMLSRAPSQPCRSATTGSAPSTSGNVAATSSNRGK
jgi:hypothetical protein